MIFKYLFITGLHLLTLNCFGQVLNIPKNIFGKTTFWEITGNDSIGIITSYDNKSYIYTWNVYNKRNKVVDNPMCSCVHDFSNDFSVNHDTLQFSFYRTRDIMDVFMYKLIEYSVDKLVMIAINHNDILVDTLILTKSHNQDIKLHMSNESKECEGFSTYSEGMDKFYAHVEESFREVGFQQKNSGIYTDILITFYIDQHGKMSIKDISYNAKHKRGQKQLKKRLEQILNSIGTWTEPVCSLSGKVVSKSVNYVIKVKL